MRSALRAAKFAVDLSGTSGRISPDGAVMFQLGRVREYFRNDPLEKPVIEHDAAAPEGLLEDLVDEGRSRLVARLIRRNTVIGVFRS